MSCGDDAAADDGHDDGAEGDDADRSSSSSSDALITCGQWHELPVPVKIHVGASSASKISLLGFRPVMVFRYATARLLLWVLSALVLLAVVLSITLLHQLHRAEQNWAGMPVSLLKQRPDSRAGYQKRQAAPAPVQAAKPEWRRKPAIPRNLSHERVVVIAAAYREDTSWLQRQPHPYIVYRKSHSCSEASQIQSGNSSDMESGDFECFEGLGGCELPVYGQFIYDHYDVLPEHALFIHGHQSSFHTAMNDMLRLLSCIRIRDGYTWPYVNLNWCGACVRFKPEKLLALDPEGTSAFRELLTEYLGPTHSWPPLMQDSCCSQFLVSRARMQHLPKAFWRDITALAVGSRNVGKRGYNLKTGQSDHCGHPNYAWLAERWYHIFFGEPGVPSLSSCPASATEDDICAGSFPAKLIQLTTECLPLRMR